MPGRDDFQTEARAVALRPPMRMRSCFARPSIERGVLSPVTRCDFVGAVASGIVRLT